MPTIAWVKNTRKTIDRLRDMPALHVAATRRQKPASQPAAMAACVFSHRHISAAGTSAKPYPD
jgi:hypothetical protein